MPSLAESRQQVSQGLHSQQNEIDHDAILSSLQDEIDRHNSIKDELRASGHRTKHEHDGTHSMRFRFKAGTKEPRKRRKHRSDKDRNVRKTHESHHDPYDTSTPPQDVETAHPFPREPTDPLAPTRGSDEAFRTSLFDALADDEGAAYWENVYEQPIHVFPRPSMPNSRGELEAMSDDEYVDYVKTRMWERKHPEIVQERKRKEKDRKAEEEAKTRRREEFVRRRERAAWERAQRWNGKEQTNEYDYVLRDGPNSHADRDSTSQQYAVAWAEYLTAWDKLKYDLLEERNDLSNVENATQPSKRIPWPVMPSKPVIKGNIEDFIQHAPAEKDRPKLAILKTERVRWHPDKVQQRFAGRVDDGTMKLVTGVFQVVDAAFEEERKRAVLQ